MKFMRKADVWFFALSFLFWFALTLPGSAKSAEKAEYRVVSFTAGVKNKIRHSKNWKVCSRYFAEVGTTEGKVVYFTYEERNSPEKPSAKSMFAKISQVGVPTISEKAATPRVRILGTGDDTRYFFVMKLKDYKAALPCLVSGMGV